MVWDVKTTKTPLKLIKCFELAQILSLSKRQIWRLTRQKKIPQPLKIGGALRWPLAVIQQWIEDKCPECKK